MTHLSMDNLGQALPWATPTVQIEPAPPPPPPQPGPNYVWAWDFAMGKYRWVPCPNVADPSDVISFSNTIRTSFWNPPRVPGSAMIDLIRAFNNTIVRAEVEAFTGWHQCAAYGELVPRRRQAVAAFDSVVPAKVFPPFYRAIWGMVLPGYFEMEGGNAVLHGGLGIGLLPGQWGPQEGITMGPGGKMIYTPPPRPNSIQVAHRIWTLNQLVAELRIGSRGDPGPLRLMFDGNLWPGYSGVAMEWVRDLSMPEQELLRRLRNMAKLITAVKDIPWPHYFFSTFMRKPRVSVPPFYGGYTYNDGLLATTDYVETRTAEQITNDIASYISVNNQLLSEHFQIEFTDWLRRMEESLKRKQKRAQRLEIILTVVSVILSIASAGVLAVTAFTLVQVAVGAYNAKELGEEQVEVMEKIYEALGITHRGMETFREWLALHARQMPAQAAPPGPPGSEAEPYAIFAEDKFIAAGADLDALLDAGWAGSKPGDRIIIKDNASGEVISIVVHTDKNEAMVVPAQEIGAAMALPKGQAGTIGEDGVPPWLLVAIPAAVLIVT